MRTYLKGTTEGTLGVVRTNPMRRGTNEVSYTGLKSAGALKGLA